jgi:hypothetical protein
VKNPNRPAPRADVEAPEDITALVSRSGRRRIIPDHAPDAIIGSSDEMELLEWRLEDLTKQVLRGKDAVIFDGLFSGKRSAAQLARQFKTTKDQIEHRLENIIRRLKSAAKSDTKTDT